MRKGLEELIQDGRDEMLRFAIEDYIKNGDSREVIENKLQTIFHLSAEEAADTYERLAPGEVAS